ncbi:MAG: hypothetical protein ACXIUL_08965 [Wenzhouxiangella sp.]
MNALILITPPAPALAELAAGGQIDLAGLGLLDRQLDELAKHGVNDVVLGFSLPRTWQTLEQHLGCGRRFGLRLLPLWGTTPSLCVADLLSVSRILGDSFLVLSGQQLAEFNPRPLLAAHHRAGADVSMAIADDRQAATDSQPMLVETRTLRNLPPTLPLSTPANLRRALMASGANSQSVALSLQLHTLDSIANYLAATRDCLDTLARQTTSAGPLLGPRLNLQVRPERCRIEGPVMIGNNVRIGDRACLIGPCYLGNGSVVESGASVVESIVLPYARIGSQARLERSVTDGRRCWRADGTRLDLEQADLGWLIGDARQAQQQRLAAEQRFLDRIAG